jgi:hypothetical protein
MFVDFSQRRVEFSQDLIKLFTKYAFKVSQNYKGEKNFEVNNTNVCF